MVSPQEVLKAIDQLHPVAAGILGTVALALALMGPVGRFLQNQKVDPAHPEHRVKGTKLGLVWSVVMFALAVIVWGGLGLMLAFGELLMGLLDRA